MNKKTAANTYTAETETLLKDVRSDISEGQLETALRKLESLIGKIESFYDSHDDAAFDNHVFDEPFEKVLYVFRNAPEKKVREIGLPATEIYLLCGNLLCEMQRYEEARDVLKKGLHRDPVSFRLTAGYLDTFKAGGDLETFFRLTLDAFKLAFRPAYVAACFRNLGYYFEEKQLYPEAVTVYSLSLPYDKESGPAEAALLRIREKTGGELPEPSAEQIAAYAERYGFPLSAEQGIPELAASCGKRFLEQGDTDSAAYFLTIAYELSHDREIRELLEQLP